MSLDQVTKLARLKFMHIINYLSRLMNHGTLIMCALRNAEDMYVPAHHFAKVKQFTHIYISKCME